MAVQRTREIEIDPMFYVPPGVVDVRQENKDNGEFSYQVVDMAGYGPVLATPTSTVPMPSTGFQIVDQAVRIGSDGRTVVDVTLDFPDVSDTYSIDVRVSPA